MTCCRRFNVPQAIRQIIEQRVGTARRNIGLYHQRKRQTGLAQALPARLANFGLSKSNQPLTEPHTLTNAPCSQLHVLHLRWGRRFMETPQKLITALPGSATRASLAAGLYRVSTAPLRYHSAWCVQAVRADTAQGLKRRKQVLVYVRVIWEDSDVARHRPMDVLVLMIVCILVLNMHDLSALSLHTCSGG